MTRNYCDEALEVAGIKPTEAKAASDERMIATLAKLSELAYQQKRRDAAKEMGNVPLAILDKLVRQRRGQSDDEESALPHWKVKPWSTAVSGATLLADIVKTFEHYIVLPKGSADALALWTLHAWTMDAGDISPFMVLVSPTKRCGKTSVLIVLLYLTPRSELASNISASALFRYVEDVRPTLLIDEADSFVKDNEEMRGILNSGHTKAAAHVIRNVEVNGEHKARRFSTWAPKAIATIRALADTLEDRAIVVQLQRKPKTAAVARLRKRDSDEFSILRQKAARWATDNFAKLTDPDPAIPDVLNDRAADNWRPLLAIADLAGDRWPRRAREAACVLSGEGHDSSSRNVELLADIREAFGDLDAIRTKDLLEKLVADKERPWVEWRHGKPLSDRQLGGLLQDFHIISEKVTTPGLQDAKGYKRIRFEEAWEAYLPGQKPSPGQSAPILPSFRPCADGTGTSSDFRSVPAGIEDGSKNSNLSYSHADKDGRTDRTAKSRTKANLTTNEAPPDQVLKIRHDTSAATVGRTEPVSRSPSNSTAAAIAKVVQPKISVPFEMPDMPSFLVRRQANPPALGPAGDSLDDFK
jgi:putative DNA primase/helicase